MIDIDEMEMWCVGAIHDHCSEINAFNSDEVIYLITRLREDEKDAARYRWLRDKVDRPYCGVLFIDGLVGSDYIDCFIDGKMKEKGDE